MDGLTPFWKKWWFWALAAVVVLTLPAAVKYAADSPAAPVEEAGVASPEPDALPGSLLSPEPDPAPEQPPAQSQTPEPESVPQPDPEPEQKPEPDSDPEPVQKPEPDPEPAPEPQPNPEPDSEPKPAPGLSQEQANLPAGTDAASTYILNTNTKKFHSPDCSSVKTIKDKNRQEYTGSREDLISQGYDPCKRCNP